MPKEKSHKIQFDDLDCLLHNKKGVVEPSSIGNINLKRLLQNGLISPNGTLTDKGVAATEKAKARLEILSKGVPIEKRPKSGHQLKILKLSEWYTGSFNGNAYITDGSCVVYMKPPKGMKASIAPVKYRQSIPNVFRGALNTPVYPLEPMTWSVKRFGYPEVIWMVNEPQSIVVPINHFYYDFLKSRFKTGKFYAPIEVDGIVHLKVERRKFDRNVVAILNPLVFKSVEVPDMLSKWKKA